MNVPKEDRKVKRKSKVPVKLSLMKKHKNESEDQKSSDEEDQELKEPSVEELKESSKPENIYSIQSIRSKQKEKHDKMIEQKKNKNKFENKNAIEIYLKTWKENHSNWKYKKLLQIEISSKIFDDEIITDDIWPTAVEYLSGSEGKAKTRIVELAEKEISKLDEQIASGDKDLIKSLNYSRARELLQMLN